METPLALTWPQVAAWRLARQGLAARLPAGALLGAASRACGLQAQVLSAAEQAAWARAGGLRREDVARALWADRTLVKTWAMRGTLHLLPADELPLHVAAREAHVGAPWDSYFAYHGVDGALREAYFRAVPAVLSGGPLTREELADAVAREAGAPALRAMILSTGWGSPLKPLAYRGELCFGPSRGQSVTFVSPRSWLGAWEPAEPEAALRELLRRFLRSYGPAAPEDFARWLWGGAGVGRARRLFRELGAELAPVDVEGWRAHALAESLDGLRAPGEPAPARLLPLFDGYTFALGRMETPLVPRERRGLVFRPQGWISAVVLAGGAVAGVWELTARRALEVRMFAPPGPALRRAVEAEAASLAAFAGAAPDVTIAAA